MMKKLIILSSMITDGLATQSFQSLLDGYTMEGDFPAINPVLINENTFHTGFLLGSIVEIEERYGRPQNTIIYVDQPGTSSFPFAVIRLATGLIVCGYSVGNCFSFITPKIHIMQSYTPEDPHAIGAHPRILAQLMESMDADMQLDELHMNIIPQVRNAKVGHVSHDGAIITTLTMEDLKGRYEGGEQVPLTINDTKLSVWYEPTKVEQHPHDYLLCPSPYTNNTVPYLMIQRRSSDSGVEPPYEKFNHPSPGQEVSIS